jgi:ribonuclease BN (tRNA processing enzyme)
MIPRIYRLGAVIFFVFSCSFIQSAYAQTATQVIILGTGTPVPEADRTGPGVAVVVNGEAYVFDAGGGMVKRAVQAAQRFNIPELNPQDIKYLFLTHLHSDHIHDVSELASSRWWGRKQRLAIYGPKGLGDYVTHMNAMAAIEADIRAAGTPEQLITDRHGYLASATEIEDGIVFRNDDITVEAFTVPHGKIKPAFGFKVTTRDKTIVISGDTTYSDTVAEKARGVDILIHEVYSGDQLSQQSAFWQDYHGHSHSSGSQVAAVANIARPGLVVLTHILFFNATAEDIVNEVTRDYDGKVVMANDLDRF